MVISFAFFKEKKKKSSVEIRAITRLNLKYFTGLICCSIAVCPASGSVHLFSWQPAGLKFAFPPSGPHLDTLGAGANRTDKMGVGCWEEWFDAGLLWLRAEEHRLLLSLPGLGFTGTLPHSTPLC